MRLLIKALGILSLGIFLLSGCSRQQLARMEVKLADLERSNSEIESKVSRLDSLYREQEQSQREFLASLQASISEFQQSLEQLDYKLSDLTDRIAKLDRMPRVRQTEPAADSTADSAQQTVTEVDPAVIFNSAYRSLLAGNQEVAVLGFREYITSFPGTNLTDDAQFWLGECYYQMDPPQYDSARIEFEKVLTNFPESDRKAGAMFKLARSLEELGETERAIALYRQISEEYPQSAEANRSRIQLEGLGEK